MIQILRRWSSPDSIPWNTLLAFSVITCIIQIFTIYAFLNAGVYWTHVIWRIVYLAFSLGVLTSLFLFKNFWSKKNCVAFFLILFLPYFYFNWQIQMDLLGSGRTWIPLIAFKPLMLLLAFLIPGPYWINLCLMIALCSQNVFFWFYVDLPNAPNVVLTAEPYLSFIYVAVAFTLFVFRYRDQKLIEKLSRQKFQAEAYRKMARVFLSMRDRMNSPLQSQKISLALIKKHSTEEMMKHILPLENSIETISGINSILSRLELNYPVYEGLLMTDQEIMDYLDQTEHSDEIQDNFNK